MSDSDIVERLRAFAQAAHWHEDAAVLAQAIAEIERLRNDLAVVAEELRGEQLLAENYRAERGRSGAAQEEDLVERLRRYAQNLGGSPQDYLTWQAAAEIERLRKDARAYANVMLSEENDRLIADNERLRDDRADMALIIEHLNAEAALWKSQAKEAAKIIDANMTEIERLRTALLPTKARKG